MKKSFVLLFCCILVVSQLKAQSPENTINLYGLNYPQEKLYIQFDKEGYFPGETIWFKSYVFEDNLPSTRSTNFYIALYDSSGKQIGQSLTPVIDAASDGHFVLPDTIAGSQITCRAYTAWMLNFDTVHLYKRSIRILGNDTQAAIAETPVQLRFFPEGGDMVSGEKNTIAFKAAYATGFPYDVSLKIVNKTSGETLVETKSVHNGMGRFDLDLEEGATYYAAWTDEKGNSRRTDLPAARSSGIVLKVAQQGGKLFYNLVNRSGSDSLHLLAYMFQKVIYKSELAPPPGQPLTGSIPLTGFPSGILQLTVFDRNWMPVAERVAFVDNGNYRKVPELNTTGIRLQKRAKNKIVIEMPDGVKANMAISVTDADINYPIAFHNIVSDMLLTADIRGYVHNPAYYFSGNAPAATLKDNLDLVMLTNGWRRYNWVNMRAGKMPEIKFPQDNYLTIYGKVDPSVLSKMPEGETVNMMVKHKDSSMRVYTVKPEQGDNLVARGLVFYDTARVFYSFNKEKSNNAKMIFSPNNNTLTIAENLSLNGMLFEPDTVAPRKDNQQKLFSYYAGITSAREEGKAKLLGNVTVKSTRNSWKTDPMVKMDERYASGMFSGGANSFSLDVLHDSYADFAPSILNYLQGKIPGLLLRNNGIGKAPTIQYIGKDVLIYLDEHELETDQLETIQVSHLAYIKMIGSSAMAGGLNPVLALYYKKHDDQGYKRQSLSDIGFVKVAGYSPVKEFYSPDYAEGDNKGMDARSTLYWQPYIITEGKNRKETIQFYNNDLTTRFRIIVEGFNEDGKFIHIEKLVE